MVGGVKNKPRFCHKGLLEYLYLKAFYLFRDRLQTDISTYHNMSVDDKYDTRITDCHVSYLGAL